MADSDRLTIKTARAELGGIGYSLRHIDSEFRVAPKEGDEAQREAQAYYTTDLADAVSTAKAERSRLVLREGALDCTLQRVMRPETAPLGREILDPAHYPGERLIGRFAGIARDSDNGR